MVNIHCCFFMVLCKSSHYNGPFCGKDDYDKSARKQIQNTDGIENVKCSLFKQKQYQCRVIKWLITRTQLYFQRVRNKLNIIAVQNRSVHKTNLSVRTAQHH